MYYVLLCLAAIAAPVVEKAAEGESSVTMIIVAVVGFLGLAERVAAVVKKYARALKVFFEVVEHYSDSTNEAERNVGRGIKQSVKALGSKLPRDARDLIDDLAANAEKKVGKNGGATRKRRSRPVLRFLLKRAARRLPVVGAVVDAVDRLRG